MEFNPDGSIKLPSRFAAQEQDNKNKMQNQKCITVRRDIVSFTAPKQCILHITLSNAITDRRFIDTIFKQWQTTASVPNKITQVGDREFDVTIETDFRRCTDCNRLINEYREFLHNNLIDKKGSCTFEGFKKNFCYEDYFD